MLNRPMPKKAKLSVVGMFAIIFAGIVLLPMARGERNLKNPVRLDENGRSIITHTLYMWGQVEDPVYQLEGKIYHEVDKVVARIGELMKQYPFPMIRVRTTSKFQRQQESIENFGKRCRDIGFINIEYKYDLSIPIGTFQAILHNGVTVELVGVCEHPSRGKKWWQPDGSQLKEAPYDRIGGNVYPHQNERAYEFAFALSNLPTELVNTIIKTKPWGSSAGGSSTPQKNGKYMDNFRWLATILPSNQKSCDVLCGIAAGAWETVAQSNGKGYSSQGTASGGVIFSKAYEHPANDVSITIADDILDRPCRVVAITDSGGLIKPSPFQSSSARVVRKQRPLLKV